MRERQRVHITRLRVVLAVALAAGLLGTSACGADDIPTDRRTSGAAPTGAVTVLAAASLTESFTTIGKGFEAANPGTTVTFSFAGSAQLATQITAGAPADVFAAASPATMKTVVDAGDATGPPTVLGRNQLVIAVAKGNPKGVGTLADLTRPGLKVALCAEQVPCGAAAKRALAAAGTRLTPVTLEQDVRSALSKVRLGEVDAALVYRTDAKAAAADVDGIEFPESAGAINYYPIVALKNAPNPAGAQAFVAYVLTEKAGAVLTDAGFQKP
jgi:molybdate transport system substrate-binding protein